MRARALKTPADESTFVVVEADQGNFGASSGFAFGSLCRSSRGCTGLDGSLTWQYTGHKEESDGPYAVVFDTLVKKESA